jgi:hypothetical protein
VVLSVAQSKKVVDKQMGLQKPDLFIGEDAEVDEAVDDSSTMNGPAEDDVYLDPLEAVYILHLLVYGPDIEFEIITL